MANKSSEVLNYFKLELLIERSLVSLRHLFKNRYALFNNGQVWNDSPTCGNNYVTNVLVKNKKINLTRVQKTSVSNGNSDEWDVSTLTALLLYIDRSKTLSTNEIQQLDQEDKLLQQLRGIRNKVTHSPKKSVDDVQFNQLWTDLAAILIAFGDVNTELEKQKDDSVFESPKQPVNEENMKDALRLNSLGTQAHKDGKYSEAVTFFTKATILPDVSNHDRATFYSNMAASRLALHEQQKASFIKFESLDAKDERYLALQDAKQARNLWPTWWKVHFRVGKVRAALDEHKKAINSLERAFALDHTKNEIQEALDESRIILSRQSRPKYLDSTEFTKAIPEILNELQRKFGTDPEMVRKYHSLIEKIDSSRADVLKGHKYALGDIDVKQDYEQAAKYFAKAVDQGNAEGMYNLARLTDYGLGVKRDHNLALKLLEQAAEQPPQNPICEQFPNVGVAESEHALGVRYFEGIAVRKDLSVAAYWYQRATDHGSAMAANNLGSMYLDGLAVDRDLEKAEELFVLGARRGDPLAMMTLAELLLSKNNFQMAKIWYDRACESGNVVAQEKRDQFAKQIEKRQQLISESSGNELEEVNVMQYFMGLFQAKHAPSVISDRSYLKDYTMLSEHAKRGSITAKQLCDAVGHFARALNILLCFERLAEEQEDTFVHELSQCYRIENIVAQIPCQLHKRVSEVVDRVLYRCTKESNSVASQLDEDVRVCYVTLHINSYELIDEFLPLCKQKYPKSIYFFLTSGAVNGFLRRPEVGLYNINNGLEIEPDNCELLYHKAVMLRHLGRDIHEAITAYQKFLSVAPKDHRKVPEVYYEMAICYMLGYTPDLAIDRMMKLYMEGKQAEKLQLPCFLPYKSENIAYLKPMFDMEFIQNIRSVPDNNRKQHLTDPHRVEIIKKHREWEGKALQEKHISGYTVHSYTLKPRVKQQTAKSLIGLNPITLREIDPRKDQVYNGYVLSVTIIEKPYSWIPSIHLVIEDENFDCERMLVYGFPKKQGEYLISELYTIGSKMHIINPYLRIGANDMKPTIRVDEFSSIVMQNESERILNMCRYCCEANASKTCSRCQQAQYCSKECQIMDWKLYKHKLICQTK
ncbi:unnamed protein product [Rotaria magnacalcarata]|uniref:MYND-type domain-containing protein n=2 Tax=Rotaria magnacalcarata TaxID=392030 RepID=A0A817AMW4_9BILA|nr:unnamed protein product [Rotaria magnacalcarata]CAF2253366.1 unnamed protein product [Rotaria magnacalcarata]CAF3769400.1 unnamed protein product [Rotaria magnacalcarata]CAF3800378.1 unnamed protein product [Rotaria magnacalcarata]